MVRVGHAVLAASMMAAMGKPVAAEVLDATYRGTMVCDKLSFTSQQMREAIEVTVSGGAVRYNHVVRLRNAAVEATTEQGTGTIDGQKINLQGSWKSGGRRYEATYSGSFVRRSAKLAGTQTWSDGGKAVTRACAGAIKRPLKAFLPRDKKLAAAR
jgi:hypothetical protein